MQLEMIDMDGDHPRVGSLFLAGWRSLVGNLNDWFVTAALAVGVIIGIGLLYAVYGMVTTDEQQYGQYSVKNQTDAPFLLFLIVIVTIAAGSYIRYAFARTALSLAQGRKPIVKDIWRPDRLFPFIVFEILVGWLLLASLSVPVIGTVLVLSSVIYAPFFVLERRGSGMTGIWMSVRAAMTNSRLLWQLLFVMFAIFVVLSSFGAFYSLVGVFLLAGFTSWASGIQALCILCAAVVGAVVLLGSMIVALSAAATAYVALDSDHVSPDNG